MRLIDADGLKESLNSGSVLIDEDVMKCESMHEVLVYILAKVEDCVVKKIDEQPTVGEWIPFKEREADEYERIELGFDMMLECELPDEDEEILVTYANGTVGMDCFMREGIECYLDSGAKFVTEAVAWKQKPEPYRGKET